MPAVLHPAFEPEHPGGLQGQQLGHELPQDVGDALDRLRHPLRILDEVDQQAFGAPDGGERVAGVVGEALPSIETASARPAARSNASRIRLRQARSTSSGGNPTPAGSGSTQTVSGAKCGMHPKRIPLPRTCRWERRTNRAPAEPRRRTRCARGAAPSSRSRGRCPSSAPRRSPPPLPRDERRRAVTRGRQLQQRPVVQVALPPGDVAPLDGLPVVGAHAGNLSIHAAWPAKSSSTRSCTWSRVSEAAVSGRGRSPARSSSGRRRARPSPRTRRRRSVRGSATRTAGAGRPRSRGARPWCRRGRAPPRSSPGAGW